MTKLIVFDCDGTIVDSQHLIVEAMNAAFTHIDRPAPSRAETLAIVGLSLPQAVAALAPNETIETYYLLAEQYKHVYRGFLAQPELREPLYDGMGELIRTLHAEGYMLGIATGKSRAGLTRILNDHALTSYFSTLQTADDAASKPAPDMLQQASQETGIAAEHIIMIGDTSFDVEMARAAGSYAIGVTWGYHTHDILLESGAHEIVNTRTQLHTTLMNLLR